MKAYIIAHIETKNLDAMKQYREKVFNIVSDHGGKYLVRGGKMESLEGDFFQHRLVIIEFPNLHSAKGFYESVEYQPLLKLRMESGISNTALVQGTWFDKE